MMLSLTIFWETVHISDLNSFKELQKNIFKGLMYFKLKEKLKILTSVLQQFLHRYCPGTTEMRLGVWGN